MVRNVLRTVRLELQADWPMLKSNGELSREVLERLRQFDTCTLSNAIERLNLRPRNEGLVTGAVTCRFPQLALVIGCAVTAPMRPSAHPVDGKCYHEHPDFWRYFASFAEPRILVIQDADHAPGVGAGGRRLCADLACPGLCRLPDQRRGARSKGNRSHAYAHVVDFGDPIVIGGLRISPGGLHGVQMIPRSAAGSYSS
jgi:hypothetical protein